MSGKLPKIAKVMTKRRIAFVLDQQVGLRTLAMNIERFVGDHPEIEPTFVPVQYAADPGWTGRIPGLPSSVRGTLSAIQEIRNGLGDTSRFDTVVWGTWAAKSVPDLVEGCPACFIMDMTPDQMAAMGHHYGYDRRRAQFLGSWKRRATARIYKHASFFLPWNEWVGASLEKDWGIPATRIVPVSPGVDTRLFTPANEVRDPRDPVRLLFVGGDFERKGGDLLLNWLRQAPVPVELHLVTRDKVDTASPNVFVHRGLTNNSPELVRTYQRADVFVLPTRADCYSLVSLEAMACGLPVVVTNLGGIPDIVVEGETGFLIDPDDTTALADRLNRLVSDPALRRRMGLAGRSRTENCFESRDSVARIVETALSAAAETRKATVAA
jgi:hypothetical protein